MMKVLVTNPPWPGGDYGARSAVRWPHKRKDKCLEYPVFLAYTVSVLKQAGHEVDFLDGIIEELSCDAFADEVYRRKPDLIVLECSTPSIDYDLETARAIKERLPDIFTLLVGSHPTVFHKEILENYPFVDGICRGEFDQLPSDLASQLSAGQDLHHVKGLSWRRNGEIVVNEDRPLIEHLDALPFPDRDIVEIHNYRTAQYGGDKGTFMVSSRGCPYGCTYCLWPNTLIGKKFRMRSPENVVDEMQQLVEAYGVDNIYFDDDTINLDINRLIQICKLIQERDIKVKWIGQARVDRVTEELIWEMKKAGCDIIYFGVESGSSETLKLMKKSITKEQVEKAFALAKKYKIKTQAFFLLGIPGETLDSMQETIDFAIKLNPDNAQFAGVVPHPGTALYDECKRKGYLSASNWKDFSATNLIIKTKHFSPKDVETMRQLAYKKFYFRLNFILKTASRMTTVSEIKRVWRGFKSITNRVFFYQPRRLEALRLSNQCQSKIDSFPLLQSSYGFRPLYRKTQ
jgi:radical SAM superfamily enzyme YgiQ (UPF0313 family)